MKKKNINLFCFLSFDLFKLYGIPSTITIIIN